MPGAVSAGSGPGRPVCVLCRVKRPAVAPRRAAALAAFVLDAERVPRGMGVTIVLAGDAAVRRCNRRYLARDNPTDVISFAAADAPGATRDEATVGDVIISAAQAARYGRAHGIAADEELERYVIHGVLHCLGYDDTAAEAKRAMFRRQEALLKRWRAKQAGAHARACR